MNTQENIAQEATRKQPLMKRIFRGCNRFLGPFLFIFFMSYNLLLSIGVDPSARNLLPYFVIPSCFVCVTIGVSCWFGDNVRQWRSYCISSVITFILYFYGFKLYQLPSNYTARHDYTFVDSRFNSLQHPETKKSKENQH